MSTKTNPTLRLRTPLTFLCLISLSALPSSCGPGAEEAPLAQGGYKKITIHFGASTEDSYGLADYEVEFLGLGVWRNGALETTATLSNGSADVYFPIDDVEVKATLVSYLSGDPNSVVMSRFAEKLKITPSTEEVALNFPAYEPKAMTNLVGALYLNNGQPAKSTNLTVVDSFSGSVITLPGESHITRTDDRGVYALKYFYGDGPVRLRLGDEHGQKELVLTPTPLPEPTWQALPFMNLYGSNSTSPFAINLALLKGDKGDPGMNGGTPGILHETLAAGNTNCPTGGVKISTWSQRPGTSSATYNEAAGSSNLKVSFICNGAKGSSGTAGGDTKIYQGKLALGDFVNGSVLYMKTDNAYFNLNDGDEPGTFRVYAQPSSFSSQDCTGPAFMWDGFGRVASTAINYVTASNPGQAAGRFPIRSRYSSWFSSTSSSGFEARCERVSSYRQAEHGSGNALVLGSGFATRSSTSIPGSNSGAMTFALTSDGTNFNERLSSLNIQDSDSLSARNSTGTTLVLNRWGGQGYTSTDGSSSTQVSLPAQTGGGSREIYALVAIGADFIAMDHNQRALKSSNAGQTWTETETFSQNGMYYDHDLSSGPMRHQGTKIFFSRQSPSEWLNAATMKTEFDYLPCWTGTKTIWRIGSSTRCMEGSAVYESSDTMPPTWSRVGSSNWHESFSGDANQFASSTDGQTIVAKDSYQSTRLGLSHNSGLTWTSIDTGQHISDHALSPDGSIMAYVSNNVVYVSSTSTVSWTDVAPGTSGYEMITSRLHFLSNGSLVFGFNDEFGAVHLAVLDLGSSTPTLTTHPWGSHLGSGSTIDRIMACGTGRICIGNYDVIHTVLESNLSTPEIGKTRYRADFPNDQIPGSNESTYRVGSRTVTLYSGSNVYVTDASGNWIPLTGEFPNSVYPLADGRLVFANQGSPRHTIVSADLSSVTSAGRTITTSEIFPLPNGNEILARGNNNTFYRSTNGGQSFTATTLSLDVDAHGGIYWSPHALLTRNGAYLSQDLGKTWTATGIPQAETEAVLQLLKNGSKWLIGVRAKKQNDYDWNQARSYYSTTGSSFTQIVFPEYQSLHATRAVTLPAGAVFPIQTLRFDPLP